jgi:hypothetical protein
VAAERHLELLGRADIAVHSVRAVGLSAESAPLPRNPNHAHVIGWPPDKPSQKSLAHQLAALSNYVRKNLAAAQ